VAEPSGPRATFFERFVAYLIDVILLGIVNYVLGAIVDYPAASVLSIAVGVGYFGTQEGGPSGQTLGKRVMNIKVERTGGGELGFGGAVLRYVGRIASAIVCLLGYFWMLWDPERQTWHDKIAGTYVVPAPRS
jgi:uncharacterized RDD family membrane protein YckC